MEREKIEGKKIERRKNKEKILFSLLCLDEEKMEKGISVFSCFVLLEKKVERKKM